MIRNSIPLTYQRFLQFLILNILQRSGELKGQTLHSVCQLDHLNEVDGAHPSTLSFGSQLPELRNMDSVGRNLSNNMVLAKDPRQNDLDLTVQNQGESQIDYGKVNGTLRALPGGLSTTDHSGVSHFSSPSASFSPNRYSHKYNSSSKHQLSGGDITTSVLPMQY